MSDHISREHDGSVRGRDIVVRTGTSRLVSSYVNVDREPIFYKETSTSWVANELVLGRYLIEKHIADNSYILSMSETCSTWNV